MTKTAGKEQGLVTDSPTNTALKPRTEETSVSAGEEALNVQIQSPLRASKDTVTSGVVNDEDNSSTFVTTQAPTATRNVVASPQDTDDDLGTAPNITQKESATLPLQDAVAAPTPNVVDLIKVAPAEHESPWQGDSKLTDSPVPQGSQRQWQHPFDLALAQPVSPPLVYKSQDGSRSDYPASGNAAGYVTLADTKSNSPPLRADTAHAERRSRTLDMELPPLPLGPLPRSQDDRPLQAMRRAASGRSHRRGIDWIVPFDEKTVFTDPSSRFVQPLVPRPKSLAERLDRTLESARSFRVEFAKTARNKSWALNVAIALQVILGSLTTGLSAVATTGRQTALQTTILGGMTTIIASFLAQQRNSNEPELSQTRVKDLDKFIRDLEAFILDYGHLSGPEHNADIDHFRQRLEVILGNVKEDARTPPV